MVVDPGTTGTFALIANFLAATFEPNSAMVADDGPINFILLSSQRLTNSSFSDDEKRCAQYRH